jgi:hypothetical protein
LRLIDLIRASTAAPTYFAPEVIEIAPGMRGTFVDGGVSPHNNPSLVLFMLATLGGYGFRWPTGRARLRIVSVGTGRVSPAAPARISERSSGAMLAIQSLRSVITDCDDLVQTMLQWLGESDAPMVIDREIGNLSDDRLTPEPLFGYARYNVKLEREELRQLLGREFDEKWLNDHARIDDPGIVDDLLEIGRAAAARTVTLEGLLAR